MNLSIIFSYTRKKENWQIIWTENFQFLKVIWIFDDLWVSLLWLPELISRLQLLLLEVENAQQSFSHLHQARPSSLPDTPASEKSCQSFHGLRGDQQGFLSLQIICYSRQQWPAMSLPWSGGWFSGGCPAPSDRAQAASDPDIHQGSWPPHQPSCGGVQSRAKSAKANIKVEVGVGSQLSLPARGPYSWRCWPGSPALSSPGPGRQQSPG